MLLWSGACVLAKEGRPRWEPLPRCRDCVFHKDIVAPGIRVELTFLYATAAIRYGNSSLVDLVKVGGNAFCLGRIEAR